MQTDDLDLDSLGEFENECSHNCMVRLLVLLVVNSRVGNVSVSMEWNYATGNDGTNIDASLCSGTQALS